METHQFGGHEDGGFGFGFVGRVVFGSCEGLLDTFENVFVDGGRCAGAFLGGGGDYGGLIDGASLFFGAWFGVGL